MKNKMVPEVRFGGFEEPWSMDDLSNLVDKIKSYSLSREVETAEKTGYKYVHYGDIHTGLANIIEQKTILPNITKANYDTLNIGDLIVADASEDYQGIATPALINAELDCYLVAGLHTIALRPKSINSMFLYIVFKSQRFKKYGYRVGTGMKVFGISTKNLLKFQVNFPILAEQQKIGSFFQQLDKRIDFQQQELDILEQIKKGLFQNMFPKKSLSLPSVRFSCFFDNWEYKAIKDIGEIKTGNTPSTTEKDNYSNVGLLWVTPSDISSLITKDTQKKLSIKGKKTARLVDNGTVLVTCIASIGKNTLVKERVGFNQQINSVSPNKFHDSYFLLTLSKQWSNDMKRLAGTGVMPIIKKSEFSKIESPIPSLEEQTKIGSFFQHIDQAINLSQKELDNLLELKKAFLQKMFI